MTYLNQMHCKIKKGCFDSVWLPQFPTSSASLNTVETHHLLYIPTVITVSRTLVSIMAECFANEIVQRCAKGYEIEVKTIHFFLQCGQLYTCYHNLPFLAPSLDFSCKLASINCRIWWT